MKLVRKNTDAKGAKESNNSYIVRTTRIVDTNYVVPGDETDVTDLNGLKTLFTAKAMDFKQYRSSLQHLDSVGGQNAATKKEIALRFAASNPADIVAEFPNVWDRVWNGLDDFHLPSIEARARRFHWCSSLLNNTLPGIVANTIVNRITTPVSANEGSLSDSYIYFGREGTTQNDPEGITDYIRSKVGTTYENNGLAEDITSTTGEVAEADIINHITNCIEQGIYYRPE